MDGKDADHFWKPLQVNKNDMLFFKEVVKYGIKINLENRKMPIRWGKLQKEFYLIRNEGLDLQLHCRVYRMASQRGSANIPRYWITLNGETIWDYPKDFVNNKDGLETDLANYPYMTYVPAISALIREYIDTPKEELLNKHFETDHWGLIDLLRASDKRIGIRRLKELASNIDNNAVVKIIETRISEKN